MLFTLNQKPGDASEDFSMGNDRLAIQRLKLKTN